MPVSGNNTGSSYSWLRDGWGMVWAFGPWEAVKEAVKDKLWGTGLADEAYDFARKYGKGNETNALRHAYWQAIIAFRYGEKAAERIGNAHEYMDQDIRDSVADRHNNIIGREIGKKVKEIGRSRFFRSKNPSPDIVIEKMVLDALKNGDLIVDFHNDPRVDADLESTIEMNKRFFYPQTVKEKD